MRIGIDTNTLIAGESTAIAILKASPHAIEAIRHLAEAGNEIVYYTALPHGIESWLEHQRFPRGAVMHYDGALYKLVTIYERERDAGSAVLIDAAWQEMIEEFQKLASGDYASRVSYWGHVTAFLFGYLRLFAFGGAVVPLSGVFPAVAHIPSWQEAGKVLSVFNAVR